MNSSILNQEDELKISEEPINPESSTAALDDSLKHLRLRHYQQETINWLSEEPENQPEAAPQEETAVAAHAAEIAEQAEPEALAVQPLAQLEAETPTIVQEAEALAQIEQLEPETLAVAPEAEAAPVEEAALDAGWDDALKHLRMRRFQQETAEWLVNRPDETDEAASEQELEAVESTEAEMAEPFAVESEEEEVEEEQGYDLAAAFDELGQEIRRVGRELFKTNRAVEQNQESFETTLAELRQLSAAVAQVSAHQAAPLNDAKFEAKAGICRELLRLADTLEASLSAANELVARLRNTAQHATQSPAFYFAATRELHSSFSEAVAALGQWRDGQRLLVERLHAILQTAGVRTVETTGRAFDPTQHRAVSVVHRNDVAPNTIVGEELRGYTLDGRILRYSEVIVARNE